MRKMILAVGAAGIVMTGAVSLAQGEVVLTGSELAGLTYSNGGFSGDAAGYVSTGAGFIQLSTGDTQTGNPSQFNDTGIVLVPNGYDGVALPSTLSGLVSSSASFNLLSSTTTVGSGSNENGAYWNVELKNPNDGTTLILNAFGINSLGANAFGSTFGGTAYLYGGTSSNIFGNWATVEGTVVDGLALGSWNITGVTMSVGGWGPGQGATTQDINSISLPGSVTPLPAALPLFMGGLGVMGLFGWRRKRKAQAAA
jgi:hypothetical protein